ncbi:hypothetical protein [Acetobacter pomorum]|uniref:hypothetical protein n=1 Tax=Acetobacter pomorum TaxID=65959 RepID=UPI0011783400|nr:hypothetical protein [Acetobacter pomorum]
MGIKDFSTIDELREAFPSSFLANGTVDLTARREIRTLPSDMTVAGHLILDNCDNLTETPENLSVTGWMCAASCHSLEKINKARVGGNMHITNCPRLHVLSPALSVGECIINYCSSLSELPKFHVARNISVSYCPEIRVLPWDDVRGYFSAVGCTGLKELPSPFSVAGQLDISGTRGLELRSDVSSPLILARNCEALEISDGSLLRRLGGNIDLDGSEYTILTPDSMPQAFSP